MTATAPTPARPWPAQALRRHRRPRRVRPRGRARHHPRPAGPQRRRQDDRGPHLRHPHPLRPRARSASPATTYAARRPPSAGRSASSARPPRSTRCCSATRTWSCSAGCTGCPRREAGARADELLTTFGLADAGDRKVSTYSGGMRRRLDIAASLIRRPAPAVPRRADHRAGPARPGRGLGDRPPGGRARDHGAAHHPVPRRGRPARRPDHRDGRRPGDRRGHLRGAQEPARRRPGDRHRARPTPTPAPSPTCWAAPRTRTPAR